MGLPYLAPTIRGQNDQSNPGGESTLDIQWVMGIGIYILFILLCRIFYIIIIILLLLLLLLLRY
jgi:hypothetical protein